VRQGNLNSGEAIANPPREGRGKGKKGLPALTKKAGSTLSQKSKEKKVSLWGKEEQSLRRETAYADLERPKRLQPGRKGR